MRLASKSKAIAYGLALYSTYLNWAMTTLAAVFGTAALSPITGAGHSGLPWQEKLVTIGFVTVGIAYVLDAILVLWGLQRKAGLANS